MSVPFADAGFLLGGYELEERQPNPFVALDFASEAAGAKAVRWLETAGEVRVDITSSPEGDLFLTVRDETGTVAAGEAWKDEMWQIFREYRNLGEDVLLLVSVGGGVKPGPVLRLRPEQVAVEVRD